MFECGGMVLVDPEERADNMPLPVEQMDAAQVLESLRYAAAQQAYWEAQQVRLLDRMHQLRIEDGTAEFLGDEVAVFMHWSPWKGARKVGQAVTMMERVPQVVDALEQGDIDYPKADAIADGTAALEPETAREVATQVLVRAPKQTTAAMRTRMRRLVNKADPEAAEKRRKQGREDRKVSVWVDHDNAMGTIAATLPIEDIQAITQRLLELTRNAKAQGDTRTTQQVRADIFRDLFLGTDPGNVKVNLNILVPANLVATLRDEPVCEVTPDPELEG